MLENLKLLIAFIGNPLSLAVWFVMAAYALPELDKETSLLLFNPISFLACCVLAAFLWGLLNKPDHN